MITMGYYNPNLVQIPLDNFNYNNQSDVSPLQEGVRFSKWNPESQEDNFTKFLDPKCTTLFEAFRYGASKSHGGPCLGWRPSPFTPYKWMTYDDVIRRAEALGSGLLGMGLSPGVHTMVGVYARNCPEWVITEQALYSYSMVNVPLFDSLGPDARAFVIKECEMRLIVAYDEVNVRNILDSAQDSLKVIVTVNDVNPRLVEEADGLGIKIVRFLDIEAAGSETKADLVPPSPHTIATICFSRLAAVGTRLLGRPKGVILSHENVMAATSAAILQLDMYAPRRTDVLYSYLPLAHTLERCCELSVFMAGGAVGFNCGNIKFAESDMKALKPTILPAVPKFLNKIYDACVTSVNKVR